jgi:ribonucleotide monophosphatase NagD (HAD superfamily)
VADLAAYLESALDELAATPGEAVMVGDDVEADIGGPKRVGMRAVLVRTGKFRPAALQEADPQPDAVIDSIADLPAWLEEAA